MKPGAAEIVVRIARRMERDGCYSADPKLCANPMRVAEELRRDHPDLWDVLERRTGGDAFREIKRLIPAPWPR